MSKRPKKQSKPNIAPAALLRVRLERLWLNPAPAQTAAVPLETDLNAATRGLKPEVVVEGVLGVFQIAPPATQAQLETWLPHWLAGQNHLAALERLLAAGRLADKLQPIARRWLAALGREVGSLVLAGADAFYKAWVIDDDSQAAVTLLWYANPHKNRVRGLQFLIDYNPPWEGSLKDALDLPSKTPQMLEQMIFEMWRSPDLVPVEIDAAAAKRKLLLALEQNQAADIRLPSDLVLFRRQFFDHVLSLPDTPDTPALGQDDFDALSQTGRSAEDLAFVEQTVGRRLRLENGQEMFVDAAIANEAMELWDDFDDVDDDNET